MVLVENDEARKAVGSIKSESLSEIRSLRAPPDAIRDILQAVLLFMGILDNSWDSMRRFLAKNGVKDEIINFDARNVTPDIRKRVQKVVAEKRNSFDEKTAKRASVAAAPLAAWVMANIEYSAILEKIQPLENEKNALLKKFNQTEKQMKSLSGQLTSVDKQVESLKKEFEESMKEATQIKVDLDREQAAIQVAGQMVERLGGEFGRWQNQMQILEGELEFLDIHCALGAGFVTFLGVEPFDNREKVFNQWLDMCGLKAFDPVGLLTLEVDQQRWKTMGLAATKMAAENAAIIFNSTETALIIDSSGTVCKFLVKLHADKDCQVLKPNSGDFLTQVELGIRFGKVIIIEDADTVEPALINLLRKEFFSQGPRQVVQIGEKQIDVNEAFKLYVCSRNDQLNIPGYIRNAVVITNFSTTLAGLSSQILSLALNTERPDLEQQSVQLSSNAETLNIQLAEIEQTLLNELATSEGSLLENKQLLDSLNQSKESAEMAEQSLATLEKVRKEIDEQKQVYLPFSEKCSMLYFAFYDLYSTNHMYNFNVAVLLQLFASVFKKNRNASSEVQTKLDIIYQELVLDTFYFVSRALYKQDRLAFSLRFVKVVKPRLFDEKEWTFFCGNIVSEDDNSATSVPNWLPDEVQQRLSRLQSALPSLYSNLGIEDRHSWAEFMDNNTVELPRHVAQKLSDFQKVVVVAALKPEVATTAMTTFATSALQVASLNPSSDLGELVVTVTPSQPVLLILGTGADPSQEIRDVAEKRNIKLHQLAMGSRQQTEALELLRMAMEKGEWVYLNNVHLLPEFLLRIHTELHSKTPHDSFRLWLSAEPDNQFPPVPLQDALKVTYETPPGIKHNISGTLKQWIGTESGSGRLKFEIQTHFLLAWFHALLQERRTFIPQGWLKFYEFNLNDLRVARQVLDKMKHNNDYNWEAIRGFMEDAIYGGRIENQLDIGVLSAYLNKFMSSGRDKENLGNNLRLQTDANSFKDMLDFVINSVPEVDKPGLFGLPENTGSTYELERSRDTINILRSMQQQSRASNFDAFSSWTRKLRPVLAFWKRLHQQNDLLASEFNVADSGDPILDMLNTEFQFGITLVKKIHTTLSLIRKGLAGKLAPTAKTLEAAKNLLEQQTPVDWDLAWPGPEDCYQYMEKVCDKARKVRKLAGFKNGENLLTEPVDLDHFFRPTALLNALRQYSARKLNTGVDKLKFATSLSKISTSAPLMQVGQLKIQGALLGGSQLMAVNQNSPAIATAPNIYMAWIGMEENPPYRAEECAEVPLFVASNRSEFVCQIQIPCVQGQKEQWILAAVALFTRI
ncbi:unnamed protein product [Bursaphelenchus okinawaensis]|uniref:Uncharacterized protein n=1 Tax=Bursaphelenchus okinawaensis TaxID=465554 RepID=A0A811JW26_9BILA|nr:unnamed protein product [Bursaphelenchus okinawaensis]CAG9086380.1 unnamed protein product [Bursaphelenchus okinawaensis]